MINFNLRGPENGVALCPVCHANFDDAQDPGFVFFPVDIPFFIKRELEDRERRKKEGGGRMMPSAEEYKRHQAEQGHVPLTAVGGLYFRCFLKEFLHLDTGFSARKVFSTPVTFHGTPFGTFRRAFAVLGLPGVETLSVPVIQQLTVLKNLYFLQEDVETMGLKDEDINPPAPSNPYAQRFGFPPSFPGNSQNISATGMPSEFTAEQQTTPVVNNHASNTNDVGLPLMPMSQCSPQSFTHCRPPLGPRVDDASPALLHRESPEIPKALADTPRDWNSDDCGGNYSPLCQADISGHEQLPAEIPEGHNAIDELRHDTFNKAIGSSGNEHSEQGYSFILGPKMTANDAIDRYRPVLCTSCR